MKCLTMKAEITVIIPVCDLVLSKIAAELLASTLTLYYSEYNLFTAYCSSSFTAGHIIQQNAPGIFQFA